jgi:hypothetical protein
MLVHLIRSPKTISSPIHGYLKVPVIEAGVNTHHFQMTLSDSLYRRNAQNSSRGIAEA